MLVKKRQRSVTPIRRLVNEDVDKGQG